MFPIIWSRVKNYKKIQDVILPCLTVYGLLVVTRALTLEWGGLNDTSSVWFYYVFPLYRLGDFYIACCAGEMMKGKRSFYNTCIYTALEIVGILACLLISCLQSRPYSNSAARVFMTSTIFDLPIALLLVIVFYRGKGIISKLLMNRILLKIGNLSPFLFLTHYVSIIWSSTIARHILRTESLIVCGILATVISVSAALVYRMCAMEYKKAF